MKNLSKEVKLTVVQNAIAAAANTDQKSAVLDMEGFDGVMFVLPLEETLNTGTATLDVHGNAANATAGSALITGATASKVAGADHDGKGGALIVDVARPLARYALARIRSGVANMTFGPCIAIQYNASNKPTVQDATTILQTTFVTGS